MESDKTIIPEVTSGVSPQLIFYVKSTETFRPARLWMSSFSSDRLKILCSPDAEYVSPGFTLHPTVCFYESKK